MQLLLQNINGGTLTTFRRNESMSKYIFPTVLIALDLGAAIMYGVNGDVKKVIYWIAAAVLNAAVTF